MVDLHDCALLHFALAVGSFIFGKCIHHEGQRATIDAGRRFDNKGSPTFVLLLIKPR